MSSQPSRALALVLEIHRGYPWHAFSTKHILQGITARQASALPGGGAHSIWEIVLHMTAWTHEVAARLQGGVPGDPAEGDWPAVGEATEERWQGALSALDAAQEELSAAVAAVPERLWDERLGAPDPSPGAGKTRLETLEGLASHHAYHGGQISLLKRVLSDPRG
jgi:uncharacterized damage-inducible protein DinB